jgi:Ca2+-binding RTX toxin-like protein
MAHFVADVPIPNGKGIIVTNTDVSIDHLEFSGASVPAASGGNGAGIRYQGGNLVVTNCYFHDNQDGLLAGALPGGTITIDRTEFSQNGSGDGFTHDLYVGRIATLQVTNSYLHDAIVGHELKSRADTTIIQNNRIFDGSGTASYTIDLPEGGAATIENNIIQQGPNSQNQIIIDYAEEVAAPLANSQLLFQGNTIVNQRGSAIGVNNTTSTIDAQIIGNHFYGLSAAEIATGPNTQSGNDFLAALPALSTSHPWAASPWDQLVSGGPSADTLHGTTGRDLMIGGAGDDTINGGANADSMIGGTGDDTYIVDNIGDTVVENPNEGTDTVRSSVSYTLPANVENLILTGATGLSATGNGLDNMITGNSGNNVLIGGAGADTLDGGAGRDTASYAGSPSGVSVSLAAGTASGGDAQGDTLIRIENLTGSSFNDTLEGDAGNNVLKGGAGTNTVSYEHAAAGVTVSLAISVAQNTVGAGTDTLLQFKNLTGSAFDDVLTGSGVANVLDGGDGNDLINGGSGNDTLIGGNGNDTLIGGAGKDVLTGGSGADVFVFGPAVAASADTITDFVQGVDKLQITGTDYGGLPAGALAATNLVYGMAAVDPHAEFIFNAAAHTLRWDPDGTGAMAPITVATLTGVTTLAASDFVVV